jgi:hypothetical protein
MDIELDTSVLTVEDCLDEVIGLMQSKAFIAAR